MLEALGFKRKTHVGISLSANNFVELVCIDKHSKTIDRYASGNVKYNNAIKEIIDFEEFREVVSSLFEEAGLDPSGCSVTLCMPNVHFDITQPDENTDTPFIVENIQAEIEDLYIFKRNEPSISYVMVKGPSQTNIIYGAIQTKMVAKLIEIFDSMGAELERIEPSYTAMLKALQFNPKYNDLLQKEEQTLILLITQSSCSAFYLNGNTLMDYMEEPIAVKSFSPEEVYSTISKITETAVQKNGPKTLFIISETDEVNAELLSQRIQFSGQIEYLNKSIDLNDEFMDESSLNFNYDNSADNNSLYMTIEAIGAGAAYLDSYPLDINFLPPERRKANMVEVFGYEVELTRFALVAIFGALLLGAIIAWLITLLINNYLQSMEESSASTAQEIQVFKDKIARSESNQQKDILPKLTSILEENKVTFEVYNALSTDIPNGIYIKKFVTNEYGAIGISGEAHTSESVEQFVNRLREKNGQLMISKISVNSQFDPVPAKLPDGFSFEIKTQDKDISFNEDALMQNTMQDIMNNVPGSYQPPAPQMQDSGNMVAPPSPII